VAKDQRCRLVDAHDRHGLRNKGLAAYLRTKNEGWTTREGMSEKDEGESKGEGRVESSRLRIAMMFVLAMSSDQISL